MKVKQIVAEYLQTHGFDGLVNKDAECGCDLAQLIACEGPCDDCEPGYKRIGSPEEDCPFYISIEKPEG